MNLDVSTLFQLDLSVSVNLDFSTLVQLDFFYLVNLDFSTLFNPAGILTASLFAHCKDLLREKVILGRKGPVHCSGGTHHGTTVLKCNSTTNDQHDSLEREGTSF